MVPRRPAGLVAQPFGWDVAWPAGPRETEADLPLSRRLVALLGLVAIGFSPGCGRRDTAGPTSTANLGNAANEAQYLAPPHPLAAIAERDGAVRILGRAAPRASVQLASADGQRLAVVADRRGAWTARLPGDRLRLYAISAQPVGGRAVHAEGALLVTPGAPAGAVMVRAGYAALPLDGGRNAGVATVDYDPSGLVAVAGFSAPRAQLTLEVDHVSAAVGQADEHGLYALMSANRRLSMGPHLVAVQAFGGDRVEREVTLVPPAALSAPYEAARTPEGWRVEWALNGGGVQTTLILDR